MPTNKHKRKASAHSKPKTVKARGLITSYSKTFFLVGLSLVTVSMYLLAFESQDNAMFGLAMLSLITGTVLTLSAKIAVSKNNTN